MPIALALALAPSTLAAQYTVTAGDASGVPGETVEVAITLDNDEPIYGFSFGLTHPGDLLTLDEVVQGLATLASNGGEGADFFAFDVNPDGGPGGFVGCVLSTDSPIEEIAAGSGHELATLRYTISASAEPGTVADLEFTDDLGTPPIRTVVTNGEALVPEQIGGSVRVDVPPIERLLCDPLSPCECEGTLAWSNPSSYDEIAIFAGDDDIAVLDGDATEYAFAAEAGLTHEFGVVARVGALESVRESCSVTCGLPLPAPEAPADLACVLSAACEVTLTWVNSGEYSRFEVTDNGVLQRDLPGASTGTTVVVSDLDPHELCVVAFDACEAAAPAVCCEAVCPELPPNFQRGDIDGNGAVSALVDALRMLNYYFADIGGPLPCEDAADVDDGGAVSALVDTLVLLQWAFSEGTAPPAPGPDACGRDATSDDALGCALESPSCD
ncbi:MAG: hypothetical protein L0206_25695 [Actinobacteria bacterium]|nr:hypothetical protein [Actinomycetota bacterium]